MRLGSEGEIRAIGKRDSEFYLSAKTRMVIWGRATVELDVGTLAPDQYARAVAYAHVHSFGSNATDDYGLSLFSPTDGGTASLDQTFALEMVNEGDYDMYAYLEHGAYTEGHITSPVPEPSTWLMLGAGLALTGAIARRRRTAVES
ncbi:PEP-CTERM sorting domain-containing protein [Pseudoduganella plicata]|nr:PEP-CTERM sorting domain-containing protein [Pseudoduganella plicata]